MEKKVWKSSSSNNLKRMSSIAKFRQITTNLSPQDDLNSIYKIYRTGTPNQYQNDMTKIKASNFRNQINIMEPMQLDYFLNQINQQKHTLNSRNYHLYPTSKEKQSTFKQLISDKQQVKDFLRWFQGKMEQIQKEQNICQKFHDKQHLIASGFQQMVYQVGKLSKSRAQILKMLWNRETAEASAIINQITSNKFKTEKNYLETSKKLHLQYQATIIKLRDQNTQLTKTLQEEKLINKAVINTLRGMRRRLQRYQIMLKKMNDFNSMMKQQNLVLLEQNTKLILERKQLSVDQGRVLTYRMIQLRKKSEQHNNQKLNMNKLFREMKEEVEEIVGRQPINDLQEKKEKLFRFLTDRMNNFPQQKLFVRQGYFSDEDDGISTVQKYFKSILNTKEIEAELDAESIRFIIHRDVGVNTNTELEEQAAQIVIQFEKGVQVNNQTNCSWQNFRKQQKQKVTTLLEKKKLLLFGVSEQNWANDVKKNLIERRTIVRNSLTLLEIQKLKEFTKMRETIQQKSLELKNYYVPENAKLSLQGFGSDAIQKSNNNSKQKKQQLSIQSEQEQENHTKRTVLKKNTQFENSRRNKGVKLIGEPEKQKNKTFINTKVLTIKSEDSQSIQEKSFRIKDLIQRYGRTNTNVKAPRNIEKYLNKIVMAVYKGKQNRQNRSAFPIEFLEAVKNVYGNIKCYINKFLVIVSVIKKTQNTNSLLKILSLMLGVNYKYKDEIVNNEDISEMYFKMYLNLSIKCPSDTTFNIWRSYTNLSKVKHQSFERILHNYMSPKICSYFFEKLQQFLNLTNDVMNKQNFLIELNQLLLYAIEVYLIQKSNYYDSYHRFIEFLSDGTTISLDIIKLVLNILGCNSELIISILNQCRTEVRKQQCQESEQIMNSSKFYSLCVKHNLPVFEQLKIRLHKQFLILPQKLKDQYCSDKGYDWDKIKTVLEIDKIDEKGVPRIIQRIESHTHYQRQENQQILSILYQIVVIKYSNLQLSQDSLQN